MSLPYGKNQRSTEALEMIVKEGATIPSETTFRFTE